MGEISDIGTSRGAHPAMGSAHGKVITLTAEQATELRSVLDQVLGDMSTEIADTDNARFRSALRLRRDLIREIREAL